MGRPRALKPCGTYAAWKRHWDHGETVCDACGEARRIYEEQRRRRRGAQPRQVPVCGTYSGYSAHYRNGEDPCRACLDAHAGYMLLYRRTIRLRERRGSWRDVVSDYLETGGPTTINELVTWIGERHQDVRMVTVRRNVWRLVADGYVSAEGGGPNDAATFEVTAYG